MSCLCGSSKRSGKQPVKREEMDINSKAILRKIRLFRSLSEDALQKLSESLQKKMFPAGGYLMRFGDVGEDFYIIVDGKCEVLDGNESKVADLSQGDYCGEQSLIRQQKRNASIRAVGRVATLTCNKETFDKVLKGNVNFVKREAKRQAVLTTFKIDNDAAPGKVASKDDATKQWLLEMVADNVMFMHLNTEQKLLVIEQMYKEEIKADTDLITQGDIDAQTFYVVASGAFNVYVNNALVLKVPKGGCFGELALMYKAPRAATVRAVEDSTVWTVERNAFRRALAEHAQEKLTKNLKWLREFDLFQPLLENELVLIDTALTEVTYKQNTQIIKQGDAGDKFYIIKKGTALWTRQDPESGDKSSGSCENQYFGELALKEAQGGVRQATVVAGPGGVTCLEMSRKDFHDLLGPLEELMDRKAQKYKQPSERMDDATDKKHDVCGLDQLETIGILGKGAFGLVSLVVDPNTNQSYALKAIKKAQIVELGQQSHIINEKRVMEKMNNPFLVNLRGTYKDKYKVYFLLDVCLGGELFTILRRRRYFNEATSKFYAGCVVEAFDYMHSRRIIYRDLKPENLVLDDQGYLKVTDFGFAKVVKDKTFTLCGTPDYLAPEIVTGQGHGKGVDWWTLGILIYEMLASFPPFFDDEPIETYRKIIKCRLKFPRYFSHEAKELIKSLLRAKPTKRLGVLRGGADNIRKHSWFSDFDWDKLTSFKLKPPITVSVKSVRDISNFDKVAEDKNQKLVAVSAADDFDAEF